MIGGQVMDKGLTKGSFKQFSGGIKNAAGTLPGGNETAARGEAEKIGDGNRNAVSGRMDTVREIEIWVNEGGAGGEGNR
jgi:uncharacterized protein YjbJ (UPF0337 family)